MFQTYLIDGLIGAALIVFAAALHSALRRFEGKSSTLSSILLGAGMVVASLSFLEALFAQVLANHIAATRDGAVYGAGKPMALLLFLQSSLPSPARSALVMRGSPLSDGVSVT